jgi:hypothetical protein
MDDHDDHDDHIIPYEEVARRRRAREGARRSVDLREVKMSDAMDHLLEEDASAQDGPSPEALRRIVERDITVGNGRSGPEPDERPRPHLVKPAAEPPMGVLCSFETGKCEMAGEPPKGPEPD